MIDARGMVLVEVKKDSRSYFFYMPVGASYADAVEAAYMVAADIKELSVKAEENRKKVEEENNEPDISEE